MRSDTEQHPAHVPRATYRLQLHRDFSLTAAAALVDYYAELGVSDLYLSPVLKARPGSMHGYDVIDHEEVNPELGGLDGFRALSSRARERGLGLIADVVPNHMCVAHAGNRWWWDVLENGPSSAYARYFDIDWNPPKEELLNRVLLPVLGDQFGRVLESGEIRVAFEHGAFHATFYGQPLPLGPRSWRRLLEPTLHQVRKVLGQEHEHVLELESILTALAYLPPRTETDDARIRERQREKEIIKRRLASLVEASDAVRMAVEDTVERVNGRSGDSRSLDLLDRLLSDQAYRLCYWRVAADEINYRRFFDINDLAAIRVEDEPVFRAVHAQLLALVREGWVRGVRIDHPDGLYDPERYFNELQDACREALRESGVAGPALETRRPFYIVAEKILTGNERLRPQWAIEGTTGYGFLNFLNGVFVDTSTKRAFQRLYQRFTGWTQSYDDLSYSAKKLILQVSMSSELTVLARRLDRISEQHRFYRDFTLESQKDALREVVACFPIYRTYVDRESTRPDAEDERHIRYAIASAKRRNPAISESIFDFIQSVLLLEHPDGLNVNQKAERRLFVMRLQQFTGTVMAKGLEDTAFYRYFPLSSLNEVGGHPEHFGTPLPVFHAKNMVRREQWRNAMQATSTHDTKRGEDVRARINVLSEMPAEWYRAIHAWSEMNRRFKSDVAGEPAPSANDEYLLYQTLAGIWPPAPPAPDEHESLASRAQEYLIKAVREAKVHTSWVNPKEAYERALRGFIAAVLQPDAANRFLRGLNAMVGRVARPGMLNSLAQVVLKVASPGVPDFYQGTELWSFSLVDPDNRRPVDYEIRKALLAELKRRDTAGGREALLKDLAGRLEDGSVKLHVTRACLEWRALWPELFRDGDYLPLRPVGRRHQHVIAFARSLGGRTLIAVTGRFFLELGAAERVPAGETVWGDTALTLRKQCGAGGWREAISGRHLRPSPRGGALALPLADVFSILPVALLVNEEGS